MRSGAVRARSTASPSRGPWRNTWTRSSTRGLCSRRALPRAHRARRRASAHVANVSVSAEESAGDVVFLHRLVRGAAEIEATGCGRRMEARWFARVRLGSFARRSGVPRSGRDASRVCGPRTSRAEGPPTDSTQLTLFAPASAANPKERDVLETLRAVVTLNASRLSIALQLLSATQNALGVSSLLKRAARSR